MIDILAGNQQLATELAFDIRKFEEMQAAAQAADQTESNQSEVNQSTVIPSASQHADLSQHADMSQHGGMQQQDDVKG